MVFPLVFQERVRRTENSVDGGQVCVRVCVCVYVGVCVCYKIFEMFEVCHVGSADYTVCLCVSVPVSVSVLP